MSAGIAEIQSRIAVIQSRIDSLSAPRTSGSTASSAAFASQMASALSSVDPAAPSAGAPASGTAADILAEAKKYVGMPYVWGGSSPASGGMDCSGLVQYVYGKFGIDLPRVSADQARQGTTVASMAEARPGDLVAWDNSSRNVGADHIAIYLGNGMILEAPRTGLDIRIISLEEAGHGTPDYIRRVIPESSAGSVTGADFLRGASSVVGASNAFGSNVVSGVPYADMFNSIGNRYGVDPLVLSAMARQESGFNPRAVSPAGAQGLMQLMPGTASDLGVRNPFDPAQSIDGAARYLSAQLADFGTLELALAAYNAGPGNVRKYGGVPPFTETQNYVRNILANIRGER